MGQLRTANKRRNRATLRSQAEGKAVGDKRPTRIEPRPEDANS